MTLLEGAAGWLAGSVVMKAIGSHHSLDIPALNLHLSGTYTPLKLGSGLFVWAVAGWRCRESLSGWLGGYAVIGQVVINSLDVPSIPTSSQVLRWCRMSQ